MSYMRIGYPLEYFKGESQSYVFESFGNFVEDYDDKYEDTASFAELLISFLNDITDDKEYVWKIANVLGKKLGIEVREHKLTNEEWDEEHDKIREEFDKKLKAKLDPVTEGVNLEEKKK